MIKPIVALAAGMLALADPAFAQSPSTESESLARGRALFGTCAACHPISGDNMHGLGPNLRGVLGRKPGSVAGFAYSRAMTTHDGVWTTEMMDAFLANPRKVIPNNAMPFAGMRSESERRAVLEYIATLR